MNAVTGKWIKWGVLAVLAVLVCLVAALGALSLDRLESYYYYLRDDSPGVTMRYAQLSGQMDEAAVRKHFGDVFLICYNERSGPAGTDRLCHAAVDKADGESAMMLVAFFSKGRLTSTVVHVPWWVHGRWLDRVVGQYGKANRSNSTFLGWTLPNGTLYYNRDRSLNPLEWNSLFWSANEDGK